MCQDGAEAGAARGADVGRWDQQARAQSRVPPETVEGRVQGDPRRRVQDGRREAWTPVQRAENRRGGEEEGRGLGAQLRPWDLDQ